MAYIALHRMNQVPEAVQDYPEFSMFGELPSYGFYVRHVNGIQMKNIKLTLEETDFRPAFIFDDVQNLKMEAIEIPIEKQNQIVFKDVIQATLVNTLEAQKLEIKNQ